MSFVSFVVMKHVAGDSWTSPPALRYKGTEQVWIGPDERPLSRELGVVQEGRGRRASRWSGYDNGCRTGRRHPVVVPQLYDQHYFAQRIHDLGIGTAHAPGAPTIDSLTHALEHALETPGRPRPDRCGCRPPRRGRAVADRLIAGNS